MLNYSVCLECFYIRLSGEFIQQRTVRNFSQVDPEYGGGIARLLQQYKGRVSQTIRTAVIQLRLVYNNYDAGPDVMSQR